MIFYVASSLNKHLWEKEHLKAIQDVYIIPVSQICSKIKIYNDSSFYETYTERIGLGIEKQTQTLKMKAIKSIINIVPKLCHGQNLQRTQNNAVV